MINVLHNNEVGLGLEVQDDKKLGVKLDNTGNVTLSKSEAGLKAEVTMPEAFDPAELNQKIQALEQAKAQLEEKVRQLEAREDIKLAGAELLEDTNELKLTLVGGQEFKTSLAKFVDAPKSAQQYWDEIKTLGTVPQEIADLVKDLVKQALKGEEVQNFAGETKGFLISA